MAQCRLCDQSGWFLSLSDNDLCGTCESEFQFDLHQRVRIIHDCQRIVQSSRKLDTKLSRINVAIQQLTALQRYEALGIVTITPPPTQAIANYERRRTEEQSKEQRPKKQSKKRSFPNDDVLEGFRFHISPRPDVPDSIKCHDNEFHPGPPDDLPEYGDPRYGIWLPETKSWEDLIDEAKRAKGGS